MLEFIDWTKRLFGGIGAENIGIFLVFVATAGAAFWRGKKGDNGAPIKEPMTHRLERIEREQEHMEERQMLYESRLGRVEGELGVFRSLFSINQDRAQ